MNTEQRTCSLCGESFWGYGNNPEPLLPYARRCCNDCNWTKVIPARFDRMFTGSPRKKTDGDRQ